MDSEEEGMRGRGGGGGGQGEGMVGKNLVRALKHTDWWGGWLQDSIGQGKPFKATKKKLDFVPFQFLYNTLGEVES